jgi:hypothetical protein
MKTAVHPNENVLREFSGFPLEVALTKGARILGRLADDRTFIEEEVLPLLREAQGAPEWYVARRHDAPDGSYSLQLFVWPPGTGTRSTTTPPGEPTAVWQGAYSKSAMSSSIGDRTTEPRLCCPGMAGSTG